MQLRGLLVAAVLLCVLGGAVYWSNKVKPDGGKKGDEAPKILTIPEDQIAQITVTRKGSPPVTLKKTDKWQMTAPEPLPVDQDSVTSMVTTLSSLSADKLIEEKNTDWATFGLQAPQLEVVVTRRDGKATKLLLGDDTATGSGYYARLDGDARLFTVGSFNKTALDKTAQDLRDKRLVIFDADKLTRVELTAKGQTVEFGKNSQNEWQIVKPRPLRADNWGVEEIVRKIREAKMDAATSEEDSKKAATGFVTGTKVAIARLTDAAGTHQIEVHKSGEDYYAKGSAVAAAYKVTPELGTGLDKGLDDLRNKKLFDFGFNDPTKVEVKSADGQTKAYQKSGEKWMLGSQEMDSVGVQSVIDKLRDLSAARFADKGFTTPTLEVKVTAKDGKIQDHVQFSKGGTGYFAIRVNEPSVYELDAAVVDGLIQSASIIKPPAPPAQGAPKK